MWKTSYCVQYQDQKWDWECRHVQTDLVESFEGEHNLADVDAHLGLGEVLALVEVGEQLPAIHIVCEHSTYRGLSSM